MKNVGAYLIRGGQPLHGEVAVSGAKNAASKQLVACLLSREPVTLENVPAIGEMDVTLDLLKSVGAKVTRTEDRVVVDASGLETAVVAQTQSGKNRIPILLLAPLLHRFGEAWIPALGGDAIGPRPVNFHIQSLQQMGVTFEEEDGAMHARAKVLHGAVIDLPYPSVMATESIILAAVLAKGRTTIRNAAVEPEIVDLAMLLQSMGAIIYQEVNRTWVIDGVSQLHGAAHRVIPDRLIAASYATAAAMTGGDIFVRDARQVDLLTFLNTLRRVGVPFEIKKEGIRFLHTSTPQPITVETDVHPGFMTDWQQPLVAFLTQADGVSVVHETVYEDRFGYTEALKRMGARIQLHRECLGSKVCRFAHQDYRHSAIIIGPTPLTGAEIVVPDIRAGFSYVLAALIANGESRLTGTEHLVRGYGDLAGTLKLLGADVKVGE